MQDHATKGRGDRIRAAADEPARVDGGGRGAHYLVDNRPEAVQLKKLREMADNSPQAKMAGRLRAMIDGSPHAAAQRRQEMPVAAKPVQAQAAPEEDELQMKTGNAPVQRQGIEEEEELVQGKPQSSQGRIGPVEGKTSNTSVMTYRGSAPSRDHTIQLMRQRMTGTFDSSGLDEGSPEYQYARFLYLAEKANEVLEQLGDVKNYEPIFGRVYEWRERLTELRNVARSWIKENQPRHREHIPAVPDELFYPLLEHVVGFMGELNDSYRELRRTIEAENEATSARFGEAEEGLPPFTSLQKDSEIGLYTLKISSAPNIRLRSGEGGFEDYSEGKSVDEAVGEAIAGLDLTGSISLRHSRHDFQPSRSGVLNLQIQLGGSRAYRVGKGDTSSTLVIVDEALWDRLLAADPGRLLQVIRAAHQISFQGSVRVELGLPGK